MPPPPLRRLIDGFKELGITPEVVIQRGGKFTEAELQALARPAAQTAIDRIGSYGSAYSGRATEEVKHRIRKEFSDLARSLANERFAPQAVAEAELEIAEAERLRAVQRASSQETNVRTLEVERQPNGRPIPLRELRNPRNGMPPPSEYPRLIADEILETNLGVATDSGGRRIPISTIQGTNGLEQNLGRVGIDLRAARDNTTQRGGKFVAIDPARPSTTMVNASAAEVARGSNPVVEVLNIPPEEMQRLDNLRHGIKKPPMARPANFDQVYNELRISEDYIRELKADGKILTPKQVDDFARVQNFNIDGMARPAGSPPGDTPAQEAARKRLKELVDALKDPELGNIASEELKLRDLNAKVTQAEARVKRSAARVEELIAKQSAPIEPYEDLNRRINRGGRPTPAEVRRLASGDLLKGEEVIKDGKKIIRIYFPAGTADGKFPQDLQAEMDLSGLDELKPDAVESNSIPGQSDSSKPRVGSKNGVRFLDIPEGTAERLTLNMNGGAAPAAPAEVAGGPRSAAVDEAASRRLNARLGGSDGGVVDTREIFERQVRARVRDMNANGRRVVVRASGTEIRFVPESTNPAAIEAELGRIQAELKLAGIETGPPVPSTVEGKMVLVVSGPEKAKLDAIMPTDIEPLPSQSTNAPAQRRFRPGAHGADGEIVDRPGGRPPEPPNSRRPGGLPSGQQQPTMLQQFRDQSLASGKPASSAGLSEEELAMLRRSGSPSINSTMQNDQGKIMTAFDRNAKLGDTAGFTTEPDGSLSKLEWRKADALNGAQPLDAANQYAVREGEMLVKTSYNQGEITAAREQVRVRNDIIAREQAKGEAQKRAEARKGQKINDAGRANNQAARQLETDFNQGRASIDEYKARAAQLEQELAEQVRAAEQAVQADYEAALVEVNAERGIKPNGMGAQGTTPSAEPPTPPAAEAPKPRNARTFPDWDTAPGPDKGKFRVGVSGPDAEGVAKEMVAQYNNNGGPRRSFGGTAEAIKDAEGNWSVSVRDGNPASNMKLEQLGREITTGVKMPKYTPVELETGVTNRQFATDEAKQKFLSELAEERARAARSVPESAARPTTVSPRAATEPSTTPTAPEGATPPAAEPTVTPDVKPAGPVAGEGAGAEAGAEGTAALAETVAEGAEAATKAKARITLWQRLVNFGGTVESNKRALGVGGKALLYAVAVGEVVKSGLKGVEATLNAQTDRETINPDARGAQATVESLGGALATNTVGLPVMAATLVESANNTVFSTTPRGLLNATIGGPVGDALASVLPGSDEPLMGQEAVQESDRKLRDLKAAEKSIKGAGEALGRGVASPIKVRTIKGREAQDKRELAFTSLLMEIEPDITNEKYSKMTATQQKALIDRMARYANERNIINDNAEASINNMEAASGMMWMRGLRAVTASVRPATYMETRREQLMLAQEVIGERQQEIGPAAEVERAAAKAAEAQQRAGAAARTPVTVASRTPGTAPAGTQQTVVDKDKPTQQAVVDAKPKPLPVANAGQGNKAPKATKIPVDLNAGLRNGM